MRDILPADGHFSGLAVRQPVTIRVHDTDLRTGGPAHGARLPDPRGQRIRTHLVGRLCHAVGFDDRNTEGRFQAFLHPARQGRRRGSDQAETVTLA
jgi:hypothetical protein